MAVLLVYALVFASILVFGWWVFSIVRVYRRGSRSSAILQASLLIVLLLALAWVTEVLPMSKTWRVKNEVAGLTGVSFWPRHEYGFSNGWMGSFELDVYQLNDEAVAYFNNAEKTVMLHQPNYDSSGGGQFSRWKRSPLDTADVWALESATMTSWVNMEEDDRKWMERIRATKRALSMSNAGGRACTSCSSARRSES
jgi:hypothetical protein